MKLLDLIENHNRVNKKLQRNDVFYSFEIYPAKTERGELNLRKTMSKLADLEPLVVDITYGAGGSKNKDSLQVCKRAQQLHGLNTMLHLNVISKTREELKEVLQQARDSGIQNILALRGDLPKEGKTVDNGLEHASDLVTFIRELHGNYFGISVAGYPESHPESKSLEEDLKYLKLKVDCGADMVITQMFFDPQTFIDFRNKCREIGITCPIIPGVLPIINYKSFKRVIEIAQVHVPKEILEKVEELKGDNIKLVDYGVKLCIDMCKKLIENGTVGLHLYCQNRFKPINRIIYGLNLRTFRCRRPFPFRKSTIKSRNNESVRPVSWVYRPESYIYLSDKWVKYPRKFWSDGKIGRRFRKVKHEILQNLHPWISPSRTRELNSINDVIQIFKDFLTGKISQTPWIDKSSEIILGTDNQKSMKMVNNGLLLINLLPRLNEEVSEDILIGFGGPGGYIFQKRYMEFFIAPNRVKLLVDELILSGNNTYHITNVDGSVIYTNNKKKEVIPVTWGVFPGMELKQPLVMDPESFQDVWRIEAFGLWICQWQNNFKKNSKSWKIIQEIHDTWFLVSIIDNDFIHPSATTDYNAWKVLDKLFMKEKELSKTEMKKKNLIRIRKIQSLEEIGTEWYNSQFQLNVKENQNEIKKNGKGEKNEDEKNEKNEKNENTEKK
ncbi:methylenetetrahydrofolate reductase [Anaeramoeba flamelloides]|uniref:Methylenetetrahydrofolate reductase n=1 Tax=Anaeramoeba flamelloides TaxID=1746091 RepID=A0ABQ8YDK0_9EUKA|nr:methylenetetrahydrofolate reductase [Anaeramoeba flamelloides]